MTQLHWLSAALFGLAVAGVVVVMRGRITRWFADEEAWIGQTFLRFTPQPVDTRRWAWLYLSARIVVLGLLLVSIKSVIVAVVLWTALLLVPKQVVEIAWRKRRARIDEQLPASVLSMSQCVQAGLTLIQAIQRLAEQAPEPIRTEFRIMANRYGLGANLEDTILDARRRLGLPNVNLFASALLINRDMGGDISATLQRIANSLEKMQELRQTVRASTSEGRTNIKVLSVCPVVLLGMLYFMDPEGVYLLFNTPQGLAVLLAAAALIAAGVFWAAKIVGSEL